MLSSAGSSGVPPMYDTSVSSATNGEDSEGASWYGKSRRSSRRKATPEPGSWGAASSTAPSSIHSNRFPSASQHSPEVTQSEPGGGEHDRFAAYINRFAELDPRMDHRYYYNGEEKKEEQPSSITAKAVAAASRRHHHRSSNDHHHHRVKTTTTSREHSRITETKSDVGASGRTRDLAKRFERVMATKAKAAHQQELSKQQHRRKKQKEKQESSSKPFSVLDEEQQFLTVPRRAPEDHVGAEEEEQERRRSSKSERRFRKNEQPQKLQRPKSLPPPVERRRRPLHAPAPTKPESPSEIEGTDGSPLRRYGRAEIETPSPAKVRELRHKLWTEDYRLAVNVPPTLRLHDDFEEEEGYYYYHDDRRPWRTDRNSRSLSPKAQRKGQLFRSRYYEAALRSPDRSSSSQKSNNDESSGGQEQQQRQQKQASTWTMSAKKKEHRKKQAPSNTETAIPDSEKLQMSTPPRSRQQRHVNWHDDDDGNNDAFERNEETVESLIAKLGKVNRDDPQAALAQIDAILRNGSTGGDLAKKAEKQDKPSGQDGDEDECDHESINDDEVEKEEEEEEVEDEDEEDDDDGSYSDETTVSSITNPTYQEAKKAAEKEWKALSAAASGRPRPSKLQSYSNTNAYVKLTSGDEGEKEKKSPPRTKKSKHRKQRSPPPPSIQLSKSQERATVADLATSATGAAGDAAAAAAAATPETAADAATDKVTNDGPTFLEKFEQYLTPQPDEISMTHSSEIEQKIKRWDDMSTGVVPATGSSEQEPKAEAKKSIPTAKPPSSTTGLDQSPGLKRAHPWDAAIPVRMGKIAVKDTSMDCGDGVEAQYVPKYAKAALSPDRSEISPVRRMRKDRLSREMKKIKEETEEPPKEETEKVEVKSPSMEEEEKEEEENDTGFPAFNPHQHQNTATMSDEFDSAWVNLPSSNYFSSSSPNRARDSFRARRQSLQQRSSSRDRRRDDFNNESSPKREKLTSAADSVDNISDNEEEEVDTDLPKPPPRPDLQTFSPKSEDEPPTRDYVYTPQYNEKQFPRPGRLDDTAKSQPSDEFDTNGSFETARVNNAGKARRRLKGFLKRNKSGGTGRPVAGSDAISTGSRRFRDASRKPLHQDVDAPTGSFTEPKRRASVRSRSPANDRGRARSLEERRIRNPSIARKFSRLLRVYDDVQN